MIKQKLQTTDCKPYRLCNFFVCFFQNCDFPYYYSLVTLKLQPIKHQKCIGIQKGAGLLFITAYHSVKTSSQKSFLTSI